MDIDTERLKKLVRLLDRSNLNEIEVKKGKWKILLKKAGRKLKEKLFRSKKETVKLVTVTSTEVGVFHRKRPFEEKPWVRKGDKVKKGDRVGFIKVLGVESEVKTEREGIIIDFFVEDGEKVDYGKELLLIQSTSSEDNF